MSLEVWLGLAVVFGWVVWLWWRKPSKVAATPVLDRLLSQHRDLVDDPFSLNIGGHYRVVAALPGLPLAQVVVYLGRSPSTAVQDYGHEFAVVRDDDQTDQRIELPAASAPRTVGESLLVFAELPHKEASAWRNPSVMLGLHHRARRLRERTAESIEVHTIGLSEEIIPRLFELALQAAQDGVEDCCYLAALQRVSAAALPLVEALDNQVSAGQQLLSQQVLVALGSKKHVGLYRELLLDKDPIVIRRAAKYLGMLGDRLSEPRLAQLQQHTNMNVRFAARDALAQIAKWQA